MSKTTNLQKLECLEVYRRTLKTPRKPKFNNPSSEVFNFKLKKKTGKSTFSSIGPIHKRITFFISFVCNNFNF